MKTRLQRLQRGERREAKALYQSTISSTLSRESLARFGQLICKADSYDLLPDEIQQSSVDPEVYHSFWAEASELGSSGHLLEIIRRIECPVVAIRGDYDPHPADSVKQPLSLGASATFGSSSWRNVATIPGGKETHGTPSTAYLMPRSGNSEPLTTNELHSRPKGALDVTEA